MAESARPHHGGVTTATESVIEVFADIVCPFTHVGLKRWIEGRAALGRPDVRLRVRAWPLEIVNGSPMDPVAVAAKVADLRAQVAPDLFERFDPSQFPPSSLPALALTNAAYRQSLDVGEATALRLRQLVFDEGVDVSQRLVLEAVAHEMGLSIRPGHSDEAQVLADLDEGRARGVVGSPYFVTPDGVGRFCPTLDIAKAGDHLAVAFDTVAFSQLIDACFALDNQP